MKLGTSPEQKSRSLPYGVISLCRASETIRVSERYEGSCGGSCYGSAEASLNFIVLCCAVIDDN
jgi:hypothetical protein